MTEMPKAVQVGPYRMVITREQATMDRKRCEVDDVNRIGNVAFWDQTIIVAPELAVDNSRAALLHELLHCCCWVVGHADKGLDTEAFVTGISATLLDTLRRNPDLVRYLCEEAP